MSPNSPPPTFTTLETRTTQPSNWTEDQQRAYLIQINTKENPQAVERLNMLFGKGYSADQVAQLCNEHGHLVYRDWADPNAFINRFDFTDIENAIADPPLRDTETLLERNYYFPTVQVIHETRRLAEIALQGHNIVKGKPELVTAEDYEKYFASFHPAVLDQLIFNLGSIEINKDCNGPCKDFCFLMPENGASLSMPFETITWLIDEFKKRVTDRNMPTLFYGSDMPDYRDGDKTSIDLALYIQKTYNERPYLSIAWSLASPTIEWIYQLLQHESLVLSRISQLTIGKHHETDIIIKVQERARKDGKYISLEQRRMLEKALVQGRKNNLNTNSGKKGLRGPESELSEYLYSCQNGTIFRAGTGFEGVTMRPASHLYPKQTLESPIMPEQKVIIIPQYRYKEEAKQPTVMKDKSDFLLAPKFITMDAKGNIMQKDKITETESDLLNISNIKRYILELKPYLFMHEKEKTSIERTVEHLKDQLSTSHQAWAYGEYIWLKNFIAKEGGIICSMITMTHRKIQGNQAAILDLAITVYTFHIMMEIFMDECVEFEEERKKQKPGHMIENTFDVHERLEKIEAAMHQQHPWIISASSELAENISRKNK